MGDVIYDSGVPGMRRRIEELERAYAKLSRRYTAAVLALSEEEFEVFAERIQSGEFDRP